MNWRSAFRGFQWVFNRYWGKELDNWAIFLIQKKPKSHTWGMVLKALFGKHEHGSKFSHTQSRLSNGWFLQATWAEFRLKHSGVKHQRWIGFFQVWIGVRLIRGYFYYLDIYIYIHTCYPENWWTSVTFIACYECDHNMIISMQGLIIVSTARVLLFWINFEPWTMDGGSFFSCP